MSTFIIRADHEPVMWDGSYLGSYDNSIIMNEVFSHPYNVYGLMMPGTNYIIHCAMHRSKDKYPCIIDEIKPHFGLVKIGTHSITISGILYIIYNTNGVPLLLNDYRFGRYIPNEYKKLVQDVFVFRMIVGLKTNFETSIMLVNNVPSSYRNSSPDTDEPFNIPQSTQKQWFVDSISDSIYRLVSPSERTFYLCQKIQEVIYRIDKKMIWIQTSILNRLQMIE